MLERGDYLIDSLHASDPALSFPTPVGTLTSFVRLPG